MQHRAASVGIFFNGAKVPDLTALLMWDEWLPIRCRHSMISLEVTVPIYPKARNKAL